jgi:hypothetical protein
MPTGQWGPAGLTWTSTMTLVQKARVRYVKSGRRRVRGGGDGQRDVPGAPGSKTILYAGIAVRVCAGHSVEPR